jgi:hypothetical protein
MAVGKKMGFRIEEMNEMTTQGFFDILNVNFGSEQKKETKRMATKKEAAAYFL